MTEVRPFTASTLRAVTPRTHSKEELPARLNIRGLGRENRSTEPHESREGPQPPLRHSHLACWRFYNNFPDPR
jgi:hypothetical protein